MTKVGERIQRRTQTPYNHEWGYVDRGQTLRITDLEGGQIADFVSLKKDDPGEYLDIIYSCALNSTYRLTEGCTLVSNNMNSMWTITEDTVGDHFCGGDFCSRPFREYFEVDDEAGCREHLEAALEEAGIDPVHLRAISCFNIFMKVNYAPDGTWSFEGPSSKEGDHIDLRAETDQFWAVSLCTGESVPDPSPLKFEVFDTTEP